MLETLQLSCLYSNQSVVNSVPCLKTGENDRHTLILAVGLQVRLVSLSLRVNIML